MGDDRRRLACAVLLAWLGVVLVGGCEMLRFREQRKRGAQVVTLSGTAATDYARRGDLVVFLVETGGEEPRLVDHYVLEHEGRWRFTALPGTYAVGAFEDVDRDGAYEDEPFLGAVAGPHYALGSGEHAEGIELVIPSAGRSSLEGRIDVAALQARSAEEQERVTVGQLAVIGEVVDIDDARFTAANGDSGLWRPIDFLYDVGAGIYFLEECSPDKVPVLFVHGIKGYPREFEHLVAGMDRARLQPWLLYYPSGLRLPGIARAAAQWLVQLQSRCPFEQLFVVAHSMGGLVARSLIFEYAEQSARGPVTLFVSISTPWSGIASASAVYTAPSAVQNMLPFSFEYVAAGSAFVEALFFGDTGTRRTLPGRPPYYLLFGHTKDHVVPNASSARLEAVEEAVKVWPLDEDHTSILRSPETSRIVNSAFAAALR